MGGSQWIVQITACHGIVVTTLWDWLKPTALWIVIQGDQKVSAHLMIIIQRVTSNVRSAPPPQSPAIYWYTELCPRRPCSVYHGPHFRMYSVMTIFKSSVLWGLFCTVIVRCTETFWSSCIQPACVRSTTICWLSRSSGYVNQLTP